MKVCLLADSHGFLPDIEPCDLLIIAGDFLPVKDHSIERQFDWLNSEFRAWLECDVPAGEVIGVAGNHDFIFEDKATNRGYSTQWIKRDLPWTYLQDSSTEFEGYKIWGSPWQPWFHDWAFNLREKWELAEKWAMIPDDTEILITHGPPWEILDISGFGYRHVGCTELRDRVEELDNLHLHVFGHIHHSFGQKRVVKETLEECLFINASYVDEGYRPRPEAPIYLTLPDK